MTETMSDQEFLNLAEKGAHERWQSDVGLRGAFPSPGAYASFVFAKASGNASAIGDGFRGEWQASPQLQRQYGSPEIYDAVMRDEIKRLGHL